MKISFKFSFEGKNSFRKRKPVKVLQFIPEEAKTKWDAIEIYPIIEDEQGICEVTTKGQESFWSVYLHQVNGGVRCIADLPTENDALKFKQLLIEAFKSGKHNSLHF